jgi:hypothetical protein
MDKLTRIKLTGLSGSTPIGALASFGVLRICSLMQSFAGCKLAWILRDDWVPSLLLPEGTSANYLVTELTTWYQKRTKEPFEWSDDIRVTPEEYRPLLKKHAEEATRSVRDLADFFTAFGSDKAVDGSKGLVKPTSFHMTSGQQKFLRDLRKHLERLNKNPSDRIRAALFEPWTYDDPLHSLGWDPDTERMYALRHRAPTTENPQSVSAAVWLAAEALPLFPTVVNRGKLLSTGFARDGSREAYFYWPIWNNAISLESLRSVLSSSMIMNHTDYTNNALRGITAIFKSERFEFGQGYAVFRPATPVLVSE